MFDKIQFTVEVNLIKWSDIWIPAEVFLAWNGQFHLTVIFNNVVLSCTEICTNYKILWLKCKKQGNHFREILNIKLNIIAFNILNVTFKSCMVL